MPNSVTSPTHQVADRAVTFPNAQTDNASCGVHAVIHCRNSRLGHLFVTP